MKSNLLASFSSDEERTKAFRRMVNMREEWLAYVKQREAKLGIQWGLPEQMAGRKQED